MSPENGSEPETIEPYAPAWRWSEGLLTNDDAPTDVAAQGQSQYDGIHPAVAARLAEGSIDRSPATRSKAPLVVTLVCLALAALLGISVLGSLFGRATASNSHSIFGNGATGKQINNGRSIGDPSAASPLASPDNTSGDQSAIGDPTATSDPSATDDSSANDGGFVQVPDSQDPLSSGGGGPEVTPAPTPKPTPKPTPRPTPAPTPRPTPTPAQKVTAGPYNGALVANEQLSYCGGATAAGPWSCTYTVYTTASGPISVSFNPAPAATACVASIRNSSGQQIAGLGNGGSGSVSGSTPSEPAGTYTIIVADWSNTNAFFNVTLTYY